MALLDSPELSARARLFMQEAFDAGEPIYISSISIVEIIYLVEKGKLPEAVLLKLERAPSDSMPSVLDVPLDSEIALKMRSISREEIADMPDRIIAATAEALGLPLVTWDR